MRYDIDYFIKKFNSISSSKWTTGIFNHLGKSCALGHLGINISKRNNPRSKALIKYFFLHDLDVIEINDEPYRRFKQKTPKARILAALRYIKKSIDK